LKRLIRVFHLNRKDSISKAADEVIDMIYASDEEITEDAYKSLKRKIKSIKKDDVLKLMKDSISIGNKCNSINNINFKDLNEAKRVIVSISNELEFHQKETIKCAIKAGECLYKTRELCQLNGNKFSDFLIECNIKWSKSYVQFLISLYNFSKDYPKISNLSLSPYFIKNNFKKIKLAIISSNTERNYWKA
jgi:hypothetical protein